jgi:hypothetical protein
MPSLPRVIISTTDNRILPKVTIINTKTQTTPKKSKKILKRKSMDLAPRRYPKRIRNTPITLNQIATIQMLTEDDYETDNPNPKGKIVMRTKRRKRVKTPIIEDSSESSPVSDLMHSPQLNVVDLDAISDSIARTNIDMQNALASTTTISTIPQTTAELNTKTQLTIGIPTDEDMADFWKSLPSFDTMFDLDNSTSNTTNTRTVNSNIPIPIMTTNQHSTITSFERLTMPKKPGDNGDVLPIQRLEQQTIGFTTTPTASTSTAAPRLVTPPHTCTTLPEACLTSHMIEQIQEIV